MHSEAAPFILEVCSTMSPSRKFGTLAKVGPKGVVKDDQFEYYDVPALALLTSEGLISVNDCLGYGDIKHCRQITKGCSIRFFEYCHSKIAQMADGTFILAMEATTFVATIHKV
ncbi:hypothetical protein GCK72_003394 [Caenorhabditis remanei]|uniref:Uncharacterized protein n=1 Tax=Caenorhabditis remanei TaxID=31234 RepID=A0A6A5HY53_CAERE|nr:hypothetical protein GCK72_003394 [Caenorhabditis remanei]KAF1771567.1 hypothetical protein GCK72_003394 [Caenorhabditis remanei]